MLRLQMLLGMILAWAASGCVMADDPPLDIAYENPGALEDFEVIPECNPGGTTDYPCGNEDVAIEHYESNYTILTANPRSELVFVNAIGSKKMTDKTGDDKPLALDRFRLTFSVRIPQIPDEQIGTMGEAIHQMILFWDGSDRLGKFEKKTLEGAIFWDINPHSPDYQHIKVYSNEPLQLIDTGIVLPMDTQWHRFEVRVDLAKRVYTGIVIDEQWKALDDVPLARVAHPEWGDDLSLVITAESENAFPGESKSKHKWATHFKDVKLFRERAEN